MHPQRGFSIVEIIVAAAVFVTAVSIFIISFDFLADLADRSQGRTEAALLLEEGAEALLFLRDLGWDEHIVTLELERPYSLYWDGVTYQLDETESEISGYQRLVTLFPVYRTGSGGYAESGTIDPDTRHVLIEIVRVADGESLASAEMLVHNSYE